MRAFTITWGDRSWSDDEVVAAHVISVAELLGDVGFEVSPWDGPRQLAAWIAVMSSIDALRTEGPGDDIEATSRRLMGEALQAVYAASADKLLMALRPRLVVPPSGEPVDVAA